MIATKKLQGRLLIAAFVVTSIVGSALTSVTLFQRFKQAEPNSNILRVYPQPGCQCIDYKHPAWFSQIILALDRGADVNAADRSGDTAISKVIRADDEARTNYLYNDNATNIADASLVLSCVKYLVSKGANINMQNSFGDSALLLAVHADDNAHIRANCSKQPFDKAHASATFECVKYLVSKGANVNAGDHVNETPLKFAIESGNTESVQFLVSHGANVNAQRSDARSPLVLAQNHPDIVAILERAGARKPATPPNMADLSKQPEAINSRWPLLVRTLQNGNCQ